MKNSYRKFELKTLGTVGAWRSREAQSEQIKLQDKRMGLLVYLCSPDSGSKLHRRDKLLSLFWPDLNAKRGRNALSKALHSFRKELGDDAVRSVGPEEIGILQECVGSDVMEFTNAIESRDFEGALGLYRGEFMPAFHVSDCPDFEDWLEEERANFKNQARRAALKLSAKEAAKGNTRQALTWARRAEEVNPRNEEVVRLIIILLDELGDRSAALKKFIEFEVWLQEEYQASPSPNTIALVNRIRKGESNEARFANAPPLANAELKNERLVPEAPEDFKHLLETLPDIVFRNDRHGTIKYINDAAIRLLGYSREEFLRMQYPQLVSEDARERVVAHYLRQVHEKIPSSYLEYPMRTADGRELWVGQISQIIVRDGQVVGGQGTIRDITARKKWEDSHRNRSLKDPTTSLHGPAGAHAVAEEWIKLSRRFNRPFFVLIVREISIEQKSRHVDDVAQHLSTILKRAIRSHDTAARMGDLEFVIFVSTDSYEGVEIVRD
ncbi:MAG: PAS domain S-box protein, partial [Gemmatimonadota bacterium]|nr:PAS domain S-box protein [Gemmatimonadota bacterium]